MNEAAHPPVPFVINSLETEEGLKNFFADPRSGDLWENPDELAAYCVRVGEEAYAEHKIFEERRTNTLTGLPNFLAFREEVGRLLGRLEPEDAVAVFLIDLDGFKHMNDLMGHPAGDELLKLVAARLDASVRKDGSANPPDFVMHGDLYGAMVSHLHGDEFAVAMYMKGNSVEAPGAPMQDAHEREQRVERRGIQNIPFEDRVRAIGTRLSEVLNEAMSSYDVLGLGASIGSAVSAHTGISTEALIIKGDENLGAAKRAGRRAFIRRLPARMRTLLTAASLSVEAAGYDPWRIQDTVPVHELSPAERQEALVGAARIMLELAGGELSDDDWMATIRQLGIPVA